MYLASHTRLKEFVPGGTHKYSSKHKNIQNKKLLMMEEQQFLHGVFFACYRQKEQSVIYILRTYGIQEQWNTKQYVH